MHGDDGCHVDDEGERAHARDEAVIVEVATDGRAERAPRQAQAPGDDDGIAPEGDERARAGHLPGDHGATAPDAVARIATRMRASAAAAERSSRA